MTTSLKRVNLKLLSNANAFDGAVLSYVSANDSVEYVSGGGSVGVVQANLDSFATYANTTLAKSNSSSFWVYYDNETALDAAYIHGAFAHVHGTGKAYFGHAGNWVQLRDETDALATTANLDSFASYANTAIAGAGGSVKVENASGVIDTAVASLIFSGGLNATPTGSNSKIVTVSATSVDLAYQFASQLFIADGTANTFTMTRSVSNATNMFVAIDGLLQTPNDDYFTSATTLTIGNTAPIIANTEIEARYLITSTSTSNLTNDSYTADGTANTFTMTETPSSASAIMVTVGGILQTPANNYVTSGTTLTLNNTAPIVANTKVEVRHLPSVS